MSGDGPFPAVPPPPAHPGSAPPPPPPPAAPPEAPSSYAWVPGGGRNVNRRNLRVAIAVVVAGVVVGVAIALPLTLGHSNNSGSSGGSGSSGSAVSVYRDAMSVMRHASGFHYVAVVSGGGDQRTVGDAAQNGGRQEITVTSSFGLEHFTLLLSGGTVYFQGNAAAFQDELGVGPAKAASLQNTWVAVTRQDGPYNTLAAGITTSDQADETLLQPSSASQVTSGGQRALRLQGSVPPQQGAPAGTGHLDVVPGNHRSISYVASVSRGNVSISSTVTFSAWGSAPALTPPANPTQWSTLGGTPPPGGYGNGGIGPGGGPTPPTI